MRRPDYGSIMAFCFFLVAPGSLLILLGSIFKTQPLILVGLFLMTLSALALCVFFITLLITAAFD